MKGSFAEQCRRILSMALYLANGYSGVKDADKSRECYEEAANWVPALLL